MLSRFMKKLKARDPNEKLFRVEWQSFEAMKRFHGILLVAGVVLLAMAYDQIETPNKVRLAKQDGRSLVT